VSNAGNGELDFGDPQDDRKPRVVPPVPRRRARIAKPAGAQSAAMPARKLPTRRRGGRLGRRRGLRCMWRRWTGRASPMS
jgi:hypothetical protein